MRLRSRIICRALFRHGLPTRPPAKLVPWTLVVAASVGSILFATACGGHRESVAPTPAHAGLGKLAYVQDSDIWLKSLPDGQPQRITTSAQASSPRWFLSGEWLTFGDGQTTWVVREDGTGLRKLDGFSSWSPVDDRYVGIDSGIDSGGYITVFTENADGSDRRVVVKYFPSNGRLTTQIRGPLWSPDGRWIAYTMLQQGIPEMPPYRAASMWIVSAEGGTPAKAYDAGSPSQDDVVLLGWSPDGHALYFALAPSFSADLADGLALQAITVLPDVASVPRDFTPAPATMLLSGEWWDRQSAGNAIAITDGSGRETWANKRIAIVSWGAGTVDELTDPTIAAMEPAWSPDGKHIAYVAAPDTGTSASGGDAAKAAMAKRKIWVMDADGSNQHELTDDSAYRDERPQWTADGSQILFVRLDANDKASLWLVSADGGTPSPVVDDLRPLPESPGTPAWWGYYGYIGWDSLFALWSAPASARPAAATNRLSMASLGLTLQYPATWMEGAAVEPYVSCVGCTILGPLSALHPYGVQIFTEDLDPGCAVSCYVGNNGIGPGDTPLGPASQEPVRVADIDSRRMEIGRQVPLGIRNTTGDDTPYHEVWTLVPWYGKALFFVAFFREGDSAAEAETRAAHDAMLGSVSRLSPPSARGQSSSFASRTVSAGQTISVWGYADAMPARDNCISTLPDMMPASADVPGGKLITCTVDAAAASRLRFVSDGGDVLHLSRVEILLPATAAPPNGLETDCNDLRSILLPGSTDPRTAQVRLVCLVEPPARGTVSASRAEFWAYALPNTGPTAASAHVDCWELARFIGAPADADAVTVPCLLD